MGIKRLGYSIVFASHWASSLGQVITLLRLQVLSPDSEKTG